LAFLSLSAYVYDPTYIGPQYKKTSAHVYDPTYIGPQYKTKGTTQGVKIWLWQKEKQYKYIVKNTKQY
jgi:hypothetical protein